MQFVLQEPMEESQKNTSQSKAVDENWVLETFICPLLARVPESVSILNSTGLFFFLN